MPKRTIICSVCGARNPDSHTRCSACGAKLDTSFALDDHNLAETKDPEDISWRWVGVATALAFVLQTALLVILPALVSAYDPQGLPGLGISTLVWFIVGVVVSALTPGKTYFEPAIAAFLMSFLTIPYLMNIADVYPMSLLAYVVGCVLGVMVTVLGAVMGDKWGNRAQRSSPA